MTVYEEAWERLRGEIEPVVTGVLTGAFSRKMSEEERMKAAAIWAESVAEALLTTAFGEGDE